MCGIAGWVDYHSDLSGQQKVFEIMSEKLGARGPDASGIWLSSHAGLAHRRLVVVDPAGGGQPMIRKSGDYRYVISYNGELYNTIELRQELESRGHSFYSNSDTEVLLVSYIEWGPQCVEHFNGIFAFAIWNEKEQSLFLARDRFGVKPLFYTNQGSSLIFASELKAILAHSLVKAEIDSEGLAEIFALGPARTPGHGVFKGISEVKPANCMLYDANGIRIFRYWSLKSHPHTDTPEETIARVRELVKDSIERQLAADVPVCTFLSGGLDSSAITAIAANFFAKNKQGILHTYSIDYIDNDLYFKPNAFQPNSDAPWVKRMSDQFETYHHYITIGTPQLADALVDAVYARDLPGMADIDSSLWLFCREVKNEATVALSGECADEVFGGYPWFHNEELLFGQTFPWAKSMDERIKVISPEINELIKPEEYVARRYQETLEEVPLLHGESTLEARRREMFYLNITWFMSTLLDRKDRMSMASGLEVRVPFCDHRLVEYVWNIPWEMKSIEGREKGILRKALTGMLPHDVLMRRKSPYPKTHNPAYEKAVKRRLTDIINDSSSPLLPLISKKTVSEMLYSDEFDYGRPWFGQLMATPQMFAYLIQVDVWLRKYNISITI